MMAAALSPEERVLHEREFFTGQVPAAVTDFEISARDFATADPQYAVIDSELARRGLLTVRRRDPNIGDGTQSQAMAVALPVWLERLVVDAYEGLPARVKDIIGWWSPGISTQLPPGWTRLVSEGAAGRLSELTARNPAQYDVLYWGAKTNDPLPEPLMVENALYHAASLALQNAAAQQQALPQQQQAVPSAPTRVPAVFTVPTPAVVRSAIPSRLPTFRTLYLVPVPCDVQPIGVYDKLPQSTPMQVSPDEVLPPLLAMDESRELELQLFGKTRSALLQDLTQCPAASMRDACGNLKVTQLRKLARILQIPNASSLLKDELCDAIDLYNEPSAQANGECSILGEACDAWQASDLADVAHALNLRVPRNQPRTELCQRISRILSGRYGNDQP